MAVWTNAGTLDDKFLQLSCLILIFHLLYVMEVKHRHCEGSSFWGDPVATKVGAPATKCCYCSTPRVGRGQNSMKPIRVYL